MLSDIGSGKLFPGYPRIHCKRRRSDSPASETYEVRNLQTLIIAGVGCPGNVDSQIWLQQSFSELKQVFTFHLKLLGTLSLTVRQPSDLYISRERSRFSCAHSSGRAKVSHAPIIYQYLQYTQQEINTIKTGIYESAWRFYLRRPLKANSRGKDWTGISEIKYIQWCSCIYVSFCRRKVPAIFLNKHARPRKRNSKSIDCSLQFALGFATIFKCMPLVVCLSLWSIIQRLRFVVLIVRLQSHGNGALQT